MGLKKVRSFLLQMPKTLKYFRTWYKLSYLWLPGSPYAKKYIVSFLMENCYFYFSCECLLQINDVTYTTVISFLQCHLGLADFSNRSEHFGFHLQIFLGNEIDTFLSRFHSTNRTACNLDLIQK